MYKPNNRGNIGCRVLLPEGCKISHCAGAFIGPHIFTIKSTFSRGWDLEDDEGRRLNEVGLNQHLFEVLE